MFLEEGIETHMCSVRCRKPEVAIFYGFGWTGGNTNRGKN
jgi:hypothetical protein